MQIPLTYRFISLKKMKLHTNNYFLGIMSNYVLFILDIVTNQIHNSRVSILFTTVPSIYSIDLSIFAFNMVIGLQFPPNSHITTTFSLKMTTTFKCTIIRVKNYLFLFIISLFFPIITKKLLRYSYLSIIFYRNTTYI